MIREPVPPCVHKTPARKIALRDELYAVVYQRTLTRFDELLQDIRDKNRLNMGYSWDGFTYAGVYYGVPLPKVDQHPTKQMTRIELAEWKAQQQRNISEWRNQKLDPTLVGDMDRLLEEREDVERGEGTMVRAMLGTVLNSAQAVSDYKRLLPSLLHPHLDTVAGECDCVVPTLSDAQIGAITAKHGQYIGLVKRRQLIYLLTP